MTSLELALDPQLMAIDPQDMALDPLNTTGNNFHVLLKLIAFRH
jgi:hypothetical protein